MALRIWPDLFRRKAVLLVLSILALLHYGFLFSVRPRALSPDARGQSSGPAATAPSRNITVNLVVASLKRDDISWTSQLPIPNLRVVRYVSDFDDERDVAYHPPVPRKGREATVYHTYFHDFYDDLPDISIMIHAEERPWHIEDVLQGSMLFALSHLDLAQVLRRGYANLRVLWENACPDWIDTTKTPDEAHKQEEPYMRPAFLANFDMAAADVPKILAGPCCSQFAVTRESVRRHPREQYARSRNWLLATEWSDYIAGRTWEHMFPWLLRGQPTDCPVEWRAYCAMYHVCFEKPEAVVEYHRLSKEKERLTEFVEFPKEILDPQAGAAARRRMREIDAALDNELQAALERGSDESVRAGAAEALYET